MSAGIHGISRTRRALYAAAAITALVFGSALSATAAHAAAGDPENTTAPAITGTPHVGDTLTVDSGTWTGADNGFLYKWSDGTNDDLTQLNTDTYTLQDADLGKTITATVTALGDGTTNNVDAVSNGVVVLANSVTVVTQPTISGTAVVGSTLTATPGTYAGPGLTYTYQWFEFTPVTETGGGSGSEIDGATGLTYVVTNDVIGQHIGFDVTATATDGDSVLGQATSADAAIPAAPFATDAGLTSANQGGVTGSVSGTTATITLPTLSAGDQVYVYGYSTPTTLGFFTVDANKQITVDFSALPAGNHKLLVIDASGAIVGWFGVAELASTGADVSPITYGVGGGLLALGALFLGLGIRSRRRTNAI